MMLRLFPTATLTLALLAAPAIVRGQSTLRAPENLSGAWVAPTGVLQFNLLHRFSAGPAPARKITNAPTFTMALGITSWATAGANYASNSDLVEAFPNEWELFGRAAVLRQPGGAPFDLFVQSGYNVAARSFDHALIVARQTGPARVVAAAHALTSAFDTGRSRIAVGGGATLRLTAAFAVAGDVVSLTDRADGERVAWSAGVQVGIPYTPHTLSLHATNVNARTLHGISRGTAVVRYGFEYTIPITLRRYVHRTAAPDTEAGGPVMPATRTGDTVTIDVRQLAYSRVRIEVPVGTIVVWSNRDPLPHSVTADSGAFDSGLIPPDSTWRHRFDRPGRYAYHCTPHPFMKAVVVVR